MRKILILILILIIIGGGIFFFWDDISDFYSGLFVKLPEVEKGVTGSFIEEAEKQISLPPPLEVEEGSAEAFLTREGVIKWTNIQREKYGLAPLLENFRLNVSAEAKVKDMFENQYFAHDSPLEIGVVDLVENVGYEFIAIGENLALGNFENDEMLLQGWMQSTGHRENILNPTYQEIGIAVRKGIFDDQSTWIAVQHFGMPLTACPQPSEELVLEIETNQEEIKSIQMTLESLQREIRLMRPKRGEAYKQKVEEYNALVEEYNTLVDETKVLINEYNDQIKLFNECAKGT
jgi:uncharacterized protein YkwD